MKQIQPSFIREILKVASDPTVISFAGGLPNAAYFPVVQLKSAFAQVIAESHSEAFQYNRTEGYQPLREWIARDVAEKTGRRVSPGQVLITTGSQQALDLLAKTFLLDTPSVAMEEPGYLGAKQVFRLYGAQITPVRLSPDGINTEDLAEAIRKRSPSLVYGMSSFQNPTGASYSSRTVTEVARILEKSESYFVEDDPYADLCFCEDASKETVYSHLDERTFYLGSFSKSVVPSFRLGYVVGPREAVIQLTRAKQASDLHSSHLLQMVLYQFLSSPHFQDHLRALRSAYEAQKSAMVRAIGTELPADVQVKDTTGGMFLWLELPASWSAEDLFDRAIKKGVAFVPGNHFYEEGGHQTLRLNFSNVGSDQIAEGIRRLGEAMEELVGEEGSVLRGT